MRFALVPYKIMQITQRRNILLTETQLDWSPLGTVRKICFMAKSGARTKRNTASTCEERGKAVTKPCMQFVAVPTKKGVEILCRLNEFLRTHLYVTGINCNFDSKYSQSTFSGIAHSRPVDFSLIL